ncbi:Sec-independent protein translocase subunit TatA [Actinacidiphila glaucinigra]|uniref:Sec-independent protein translocase subunit TatA n=1 Tax=Actinacidiphila glaucinigra TaxID=235986 RepID=UPI0029B7775E|nr:Sec-independent protein translocase subunit TatA [Streptomyces sp. PA03-3a]
MFGRLGAPEILLILVVVLLLFGAKRLPDMARSFGQSLRILRSETKAMRDDDGDGTTGPAPAPALAGGDRTPHAAPGDAVADAPHRR